MADVAKILEEKGGDVVRVDGDATVFDAVRAMVEANVGAVLVGDDLDRVEGIFTERDFLRRVALEELSLNEAPVRQVMSSPLIIVTPKTSVESAMALMTDRRIRHIP